MCAFIGLASDREMVGIDIDFSVTMEELCARVRAASMWHRAISREIEAVERSCNFSGNLAFVGEMIVDILQRRKQIIV